MNPSLPADISRLVTVYATEPLYGFPDWVKKRYRKELLRHMGWNPRAVRYILKCGKCETFPEIGANPHPKIIKYLQDNKIQEEKISRSVLLNPSTDPEHIKWFKTIFRFNYQIMQQQIDITTQPELVLENFDELARYLSPQIAGIPDQRILNKVFGLLKREHPQWWLSSNPDSIELLNNSKLVHVCSLFKNPNPRIIKILEHKFLNTEHEPDPVISDLFRAIMDNQYDEFVSEISGNPNAAHILKARPDLIDPKLISSNPALIELLDTGIIDPDTIRWNQIHSIKTPELIQVLENNLPRLAYTHPIIPYTKIDMIRVAQNNLWLLVDKYKYRLINKVINNLEQ